MTSNGHNVPRHNPMARSIPMTGSPRCKAHNRQGAQCGHLAMQMQTVCRFHGGKQPAALANAEDRMRALVHPAVTALANLIADNDLAAARYVLDYAGFKAKEKLETSGETTIRYVNDWRRSLPLSSSKFEVSEKVDLLMAEHWNAENATNR